MPLLIERERRQELIDGALRRATLRLKARNVDQERAAAVMEARFAPMPTPPDIVDWAEASFYTPETGKPIRLERFQAAILRKVFQQQPDGRWPYTTVVWSTIKKSGKTAVAGLVARWAAETWGRHGEVSCLANDFEQAQGRIYQALIQSIEGDPVYDRRRRELPGLWRLLDRKSTHLPSGTVVSALAVDFKGEAGSNPSLTLWSELWGFMSEDGRRLWDELTPVPTRPNSMRWVETYAGFEGESDLLLDLYEAAVKNGRQLTAGELGQQPGDPPLFAEAPEPDMPVPVYVNDAARTLAYWDEGPQARRMPWQRGTLGAEYYQGQAATLRPNAYARLHENSWVSSESSFVPMESWDACLQSFPLAEGDRTPVVLGMDAAVTGDCFGVTAVTRHPDQHDAIALRYCWKFDPPKGGAIDYSLHVEPLIREIARRWNVQCISYDPYQLHDFATRMGRELSIWFRAFPQGDERLRADKQLYDLIVQRRLAHNGDADLRQHVANANAKIPKGTDSQMRIVKRVESHKIDLVVATSMAAYDCLRLNL